MSYEKILPPTNCPSCSAELTRVKDQLFCTNTITCPAQSLGKVINFCKRLKIKGFGEATVSKLGLETPEDLVSLTVEHAESCGLSNHMATKLVNVVQARLEQKIEHTEFLAAQSIVLIGDTASSKLTGINAISDITEELSRAKGLGEKATEHLVTWVNNTWRLIEDIWTPHLTYKKSTATSSKKQLDVVVVITGKLTDFKNRSEASEHLEKLGFTVKSTVTKDTKYLVCEDGTTGSSYQKAKSLNIPITTIKTLEDIFK